VFTSPKINWSFRIWILNKALKALLRTQQTKKHSNKSVA